MEYLTKKYGDKEEHHQSLARQLSHATEKVIGWLVYCWLICFEFFQVAEMEKQKQDKNSFERLQKGAQTVYVRVRTHARVCIHAGECMCCL